MTSDLSLSLSGDMVLLARVAEAGSISAAGRIVGLERTTVSRRLARLEGRLGADLLNRSNREVTLTDAGLLYYQFCQKVIEAAEDGFSQLTNQNTSPDQSALVELAIPDAARFISSVSIQADSAQTDVHTEYRMGDSSSTTIDPECDLSLQLRFYSMPTDDTVIEIGSVPQSMWISSAFHGGRNDTLSFDDLASIPFIYAAQQPCRSSWTFQRGPDVRSVDIGPKLQVRSLEICRNLCLEGSGIVILPNYMCESFLVSRQLRPLMPEWNIEEALLVAVHARNKFLKRNARSHIERLRAEIGKLSS